MSIQNESLKEPIAEENFFKIYSELQPENCVRTLSGIDHGVIKRSMLADLGKEKTLSCRALRNLGETHCMALLDSYLNLDREAYVLYQLLQQNSLFSGVNQNNKTIQKINSVIYHALKEDDYGLNDFKDDLFSIVANVSGDDPALGEIKSSIENALEFARLRPKPELKKKA